MKKNKKSFEEAINELEEIVQKLENGELSLDEAMETFQRGVELSKFCNKTLDDVEKKITVLIENESGEIIEKDFIPEA